jgi:Flp pilus assembly pilin Flp
MLYRLSYVRARIILPGDTAIAPSAQNASNDGRAVRPLGRFSMHDHGWMRREDGQTMSEYAVILGVITPAIIVALGLLSDAVQGRIETVIGFFS